MSCYGCRRGLCSGKCGGGFWASRSIMPWPWWYARTFGFALPWFVPQIYPAGGGVMFGQDALAATTPEPNVLMQMVAKTEKMANGASPREIMFLRIGLRASHLEEALAAGDFARARVHADALWAMLQGLEQGEIVVR